MPYDPTHYCCCGCVHLKAATVLIGIYTVCGAVFSIYDATAHFGNQLLKDFIGDTILQVCIICTGSVAVIGAPLEKAYFIGPLVIHFAFEFLTDGVHLVKFLFKWYQERRKHEDYYVNIVNWNTLLEIVSSLLSLWFVVVLKHCYMYLSKKSADRRLGSERQVSSLTRKTSGESYL